MGRLLQVQGGGLPLRPAREAAQVMIDQQNRQSFDWCIL
jgi:hypothetical protein